MMSTTVENTMFDLVRRLAMKLPPKDKLRLAVNIMEEIESHLSEQEDAHYSHYIRRLEHFLHKSKSPPHPFRSKKASLL